MLFARMVKRELMSAVPTGMSTRNLKRIWDVESEGFAMQLDFLDGPIVVT